MAGDSPGDLRPAAGADSLHRGLGEVGRAARPSNRPENCRNSAEEYRPTHGFQVCIVEFNS